MIPEILPQVIGFYPIDSSCPMRDSDILVCIQDYPKGVFNASVGLPLRHYQRFIGTSLDDSPTLGKRFFVFRPIISGAPIRKSIVPKNKIFSNPLPLP